jgi:hypothetical protein
VIVGDKAMFVSVEGVYRHGQIELKECPKGMPEDTLVLVTFLGAKRLSLPEINITREEAAEIRFRLQAFAADWDSPEMDVYDDYDNARAHVQGLSSTSD